ncbi:MAG: ATP-binding cassette domain-containing protein [Candidatus Marinimicrobia bacterium]|nr:ATP-binding cassette domain-containing protein [Candidatus Neomarinimicrobiota bacterium]
MIRIEKLKKSYDTVDAVKGIDFVVNDGEILGFLGPNGAGKTTTLRMITSYLSPTEGNVKIDDLDVTENSDETRKLIGYLPEHNPLYDDMIVYDFLEFVSKARQIDPKDFPVRLREVIDLCGLKKVIHRPIRELSKGYRQRVGLAQAIIHDPKILILDEPTTGLDPNQIVEIRELIKALGKEKTVIISSHILQEIQAVADRTIIINNGEIAADGTVEELMSSFQGHTQLELELLNASDEDIHNIVTVNESITISTIEKKEALKYVKLEYPNTIDPREIIFDYANRKNWKILEMSRHKVSLEDVFRNLTVEGGAADAK